ncbi:rubrerythrin family protein [Halorussus salilacus]|uniref:rubrerythrin family protein n=1 Tax=Halorussus salilacus TaxID=2953750 RepID=UPI0020A0DEB8|nr:rubrerythrin family protein [Halorussus salilacus]USZ68986.1 rubrerythrin family protein [Halorussus salilacus]
MDADSFVTEVEEAKATELDRLGSQQSLVALTDADLDAESVLRAAARSERVARETFAEWAETEANADASEAFAGLARQETDHYERVVAELGDEAEDFGPEGPDPMHEYLRGLDSTVERAAGLVGRSLASERTQLQVVNFFVNDADERRADCFRELRAETQDGISAGAELLEETCDGEDDWERARKTAEETVRVAYDDYAETLEGMGLDPRPIC